MTAVRIPVLMYHRIGDQSTGWDRHYSVTPRTFARQMEALAHRGYRASSLEAFLGWRRQTSALPEKSLLVTFDDGFAGVFDHALPVLRDLQWPFTVFMVSGKIGQPADWSLTPSSMDRSRCLMGAAELESLLTAGASIQSHGTSHRDLTNLDDGDLEGELIQSREALATLTGQAVKAIAYPFGRHDERVAHFTRQAGYEAAFSVLPGFNRPQTAPFALHRLDVFGTDSSAQLLRKVKFGSNDGSLTQSLRYLTQRIALRLQPKS